MEHIEIDNRNKKFFEKILDANISNVLKKQYRWDEKITDLNRKMTRFFDALKEGPWPQCTSGQWFLYKLVENRPEVLKDMKKYLDFSKSPEVIWYDLSKIKPADGLNIAEVAGKSYARLTSFLGGKGTFWKDHNAGIFLPYEKSQDNGKIYTMDDCRCENICANSSYCNAETCNEVFKNKDYDLFLAVNHGVADEEYLKIAEKLLKDGKTVDNDTYIDFQNDY